MNFFAELVKFFFGPSSAWIFNTVQMNFYSLLVQGFDLIEHINNTPVIGRIRHIK